MIFKVPIHNIVINPDTQRERPAKRVYTVWIVPTEDEGWRMYHCPDCRTPICQYKGDLVAEMPGESPEPYPIQIQCKNPQCGRKIVFEAPVHQIL